MVDGVKIGEMTSSGAIDRLKVDSNLYFGGFPGPVTPYVDIRGTNYTGCIEDVFLGPDRIELVAGKEGAVGVEAGCLTKV